MAEPKTLTVRLMAAAGVLLTFIPLLVCVGAGFWLSGTGRGALWGAAAFLLYRLILVRRLLCRDHLRGLGAMRRGDFATAAAAFARSEEIWRRRPWLDRHRAWLLGSASRYSFALMSKYNRAFALARHGQGRQARSLCDEILQESPGNVLAVTLRDLLDAGRAQASAEQAAGVEQDKDEPAEQQRDD